MPYILIPKRKSLPVLEVDIFAWPFMLKYTGMGYVLGYGAAKNPLEYFYKVRNIGSPETNDGYVVTEAEAIAMSKVAHGFVEVQRAVNKDWEKLTPEDRKYQKNNSISSVGTIIYTKEIDEERLKEIKEFAIFAQQSKGFTIN